MLPENRLMLCNEIKKKIEVIVSLRKIMVLGVQSPMSRFLRIVARNGLQCFTPFVNHSQTFEIKEIIKPTFVTS